MVKLIVFAPSSRGLLDASCSTEGAFTILRAALKMLKGPVNKCCFRRVRSWCGDMIAFGSSAGGIPGSCFIEKKCLGYNIGHGLFVGWVEHSDIFCWVSPPADQLAYQPFFAISETQQNGRR
jgi:hypothetical protein